MLAFESQTPQELLKEIAEFLRYRAAQENAVASRQKPRAAAITTARANTFTAAALDLEGAAIVPEHSPLRTPPDNQCAVCGVRGPAHGPNTHKFVSKRLSR